MDQTTTKEDYRNHFFLRGRDLGPCRSLRGNIALLSVFLHRKEGDFPPAHRSAYYATARAACAFLEKEAAKCGVDLSFSRYHFDVQAPPDVSERSGFPLIAPFFEMEDMPTLSAHYKKRLGTDACVFVLVFDGAGRSYSVRQLAKDSPHNELSVVFYNMDKSPENRKQTLLHELLHQYGAPDYYYPAAVREAAARWLQNSVMGVGDAVVDDLTAYIIGWRNTLTERAVRFLDDTAFMTQQEYKTALAQEWEHSRRRKGNKQ